MNKFAWSILTSFALTATSFGQAPAAGADEKQQVAVNIKRVTLGEQPTPQYMVGNVKDKRWRAKNWVEVDVEYEIKLSKDLGGRVGTLPAMQLTIYLALQHSTPDGKKREVLQGTLDLINIPAGETCHSLAYVSPATMKLIFQKDTFTVSTDIQGYGVEFVVDGKVIRADSSVGKTAWWENTESFALLQGLLLSKAQSPFALLWGDYDVPVKAK